MANLAKIIEGTGAEIVISSSWKCMGLAVLKKMWEDRKMPGKIIDVTPNAITDEIYHGLTMNDYWAWRGLEIKEWLLRHPEKVSNYVIIDDNGGMLGEQEDYIVQTDPSVGITEWDAKKAINILTNEGNS